MTGISRTKLLDTVLQASDGTISRAELDAARGSLQEVGYNSVSYMRLLEAIEEEFGVEIDPEDDPEYLESVDRLVEFVSGQLGAPIVP